MANELRTRTNFVGGLVEDNPLTNVATTLTSAGLAALPVIDTTNHAALILDPDGIHGPPEIVWVTAHTASSTTATILRAQESTSARQHLRDTYWVHTATVRDFETAYTNFVPTISQGGSLTTSTLTARYSVRGKKVHYRGYAVLSSAGSGGEISVTLPINRAADYVGKEHVGTGMVEDAGTLFINSLICFSGQTLRFRRTDTATESRVGNSPSFNLASGDRLSWDITYESE